MGNAHAVLVLGAGSIGRRHLRNLAVEYPETRLAAYDPRAENVSGLAPSVVPFDDAAAAWDWFPDIVFVCSPSSEHLSAAREALRRGCHVFIEKPLAHTLDGLREFVELCESSGRVVQVGANMRYHPGPRMLRRLLDEGAVGRVLSVSTTYGGYLPDWRPSQDYRSSYSAQAGLGGGVLLDVIHEVDTALWYLGTPVAVTGLASRSGLLEIDTEDQARVLIRGETGALADVRLDYLQKPVQRNYSIIGNQGRLDWDIHHPHIRGLDREGREELVPLISREMEEPGHAYVEQLREFMWCIDTGRRPMVSAREGALAVTVALLAREASGAARVVTLGGGTSR
jgi:predicted dehydrogenase